MVINVWRGGCRYWLNQPGFYRLPFDIDTHQQKKRSGKIQKDIWKFKDISNIVNLTFLCRIFGLFVLPEWFLWITTIKDLTRNLCYHYVNWSKYFHKIPSEKRSFFHLIHLSVWLAWVVDVIPPVILIFLLLIIPMI